MDHEPAPHALRLIEAAIFASREPVLRRTLAGLLPDDTDLDAAIAALRALYAGRGVELVEVGHGLQFRTAPDLAASLRKLVEVPRRLARAAMETLAIIAWHQPVTRAQIEEIRGAALSQQTMDALLEASLVRTAGHREVPGRPILWATTPEFLTVFGLRDLKDLPRRDELVLESVVSHPASGVSEHDPDREVDPRSAVGYQPSEQAASDD